MKQIIIPDIHGRNTWEHIVEKHKDADRIIFLGDYLDTHEDITGLEQVENLRKIIKFKEEKDEQNRWVLVGADIKKQEVILLIGNHDHHYFPSVGYTGTSGYQHRISKSFEYELDTHKELFQMSFVDENKYVYSHAGITKSFLSLHGIPDTLEVEEMINRVNELFIYTPRVFTFHPNDRSGYGNHILQSPIWVRPESLYRDAIKQLQIVGHTQQTNINPHKSERQNYWLVDTLGTSKEFLVIKDGNIEIDKL